MNPQRSARTSDPSVPPQVLRPIHRGGGVGKAASAWRRPPAAVQCLAAIATSIIIAAGSNAAEPSLFFRATFDGAGDAALAALGDRPLAPAREEATEYIKSDHDKALHLGADCVLAYDLGDGFPARAGSIEIRFKPGFPQKPDQVGRVIATLTGAAGAGLDFGFEPHGTRWQFRTLHPEWQRKIAASYFDTANEERWNHLVLTWDEKAMPVPALRFYRDGRWDRARTETFAASFEGLRRLVIGGEGQLHTSIDEIVIYNHALSESDIGFLHGAFGRADRFAALQEKRAKDAELASSESEARAALIARLQGRVAQIINPRGGRQRDFQLPGGIVATGLRVEDVGTVDLSRFAVIHGPPGGGYQLTREQDEVIRRYVQRGGGYVGVCAGANYAGRAKLLNMTTHSLKNQGLLTMGVKPHPITRGFHEEVVIHHGNGPIMIPGAGCEVVGTFQIGQNFPVTTAAIVAGRVGEGRVVAIGPHPTGGGVAYQQKGAKFGGDELGTEDLLVNALLWAAKIIDEDPSPSSRP